MRMGLDRKALIKYSLYTILALDITVTLHVVLNYMQTAMGF